MKPITYFITEMSGKVKPSVPDNELKSYKYYDVCVYDNLMRSWQSSITTDNPEDGAFKSYEDAVNKCNAEIEEGYYKGLQILGSNDCESWNVIATWGRQHFTNRKRY